MWGAVMVWRQGQSYSEDLRARVLGAIDGGMRARAAAAVFRVSVSYIYKALIRRRRTGETSASTRRGHRPRKLSGEQGGRSAPRSMRSMYEAPLTGHHERGSVGSGARPVPA